CRVTRTRAGRLARRGSTRHGSLRADGLAGRGGSLRSRAPARRASGLRRESLVRRRGTAFMPERLQHGLAAPLRRASRLALSLADLVRDLLAAAALPRHAAFARGRQVDAGSPRLRQPDRDRLLGRPRAVLALADVMDLLADELAGLRAG